MNRHLKITLLSVIYVTCGGFFKIHASKDVHPNLSIIEKFRSDDYINLGNVLGAIAQLDLKPIHKGDDILLKGRELKFIEKAGDVNVCNGSNGSWIEAINFDIGDHPYQLNVLASAECHHVKLQPLFVGSSITTPELFFDVAYPFVHDHMYAHNLLEQKFRNRNDFLKTVTFEIKPLEENSDGFLEEWTVHHQNKTFKVNVQFSPVASGKYAFSLI